MDNVDIDQFKSRDPWGKEKIYSDDFDKGVAEFLEALSIDPVTHVPSIKQPEKNTLAHFYTICIYLKVIDYYPAMINDTLKREMAALIDAEGDPRAEWPQWIQGYLRYDMNEYHKSHNLRYYNGDRDWIGRFIMHIFKDVPISKIFVNEDLL